MAQYQDHMLILKARAYRENDWLVTLFGMKSGKISAIAKGARRPKSRLAGIYPLSYNICEIFHGRSNLDTLIGLDVVDGFSGMRNDLTRLSWGMMLADLVDEMWSERDASLNVFPWVVAAWQELAARSDPLTSTLTASWQLMRLAGYFPQWQTCSACGQIPSAGPVWIDPLRGAMLCASHRARADTEVSLSLGALRTWQQWMNLEVGKIGQYEAKGVIGNQLFSLFRLYVQGHIGRLPRSLQFLLEVENMEGEGEDKKS